MSLATTSYEHIVLTEDHVPLIAGTNMKVIELVLEQSAHGWSADAIPVRASCYSRNPM